MNRFIGAVVVTVLALGLSGQTRADDKDAMAIVDKAIKALGGEEKLKKADAASWKSKGAVTFGGNDHEIVIVATVQGLDRYHADVEFDLDGNRVKGWTIVNGDHGWRKFGEETSELDNEALANEKRAIYLQVVPFRLLPLKGKGFKIETAGEEKVGDKPAAGVKVTGPDGKDFTIYFDKESGLPVKQVARVIGFGGEEFEQETSFNEYKDIDGVKKATKLESKRNGEKFVALEVSDFKVLDKVSDETFAQPK